MTHPHLHVGIDASNLRRGGGVTHLVEVLRAADPVAHGIARITVWAGRATLDKLPDRQWLVPRHAAALDRSLPARLAWQRFGFDRAATQASCDLLFVPGGTYVGRFRPVVTMSRNLLPFDTAASSRYGTSFQRLRIALLRFTQSRTFRNADGVIFLSQAARQHVEAITGPLRARVAVIPHGIFRAAFRKPQAFPPPDGRAFRLLYVSTVDRYKNQWVVVRAVSALRRRGISLELVLVGAAEAGALRRLTKAMREEDPEGTFVKYMGEVPHEELPSFYHDCDAFVFASACENLPNILLEAMAASLPIASSHLGVMPEILGDAGIYFDPDDEASIADAIGLLLEDSERRARLGALAHERATAYSWERCARETFALLAEVAQLTTRNASR